MIGMVHARFRASIPPRRLGLDASPPRRLGLPDSRCTLALAAGPAAPAAEGVLADRAGMRRVLVGGRSRRLGGGLGGLGGGEGDEVLGDELGDGDEPAPLGRYQYLWWPGVRGMEREPRPKVL